MTSAVLTLDQVAAEVGLSPSRFRRVWTSMVNGRAFPSPISQPPGANYRWSAPAVAAWIEARSRALGQAGRASAANDIHPADRLTGPAATPNEARAPWRDTNFRRAHAQLLRQIQGAR